MNSASVVGLGVQQLSCKTPACRVASAFQESHKLIFKKGCFQESCFITRASSSPCSCYLSPVRTECIIFIVHIIRFSDQRTEDFAYNRRHKTFQDFNDVRQLPLAFILYKITTSNINKKCVIIYILWFFCMSHVEKTF